MRYFVLTKSFDGGDSHALMDGPAPRPASSGAREFARRCRYIYLSEAAESLSLSQLIALHKAGELEGSKVWTAPDPHRPIARERKPAYRPRSETTIPSPKDSP